MRIIALSRRADQSWPALLGRCAWLVNSVLIVAIAYSLAQLTWLLLMPAAPATTRSPQQPDANLAVTTDALDIARLAGWHLFGKPSANQPAPQAIGKAPETRLDLRLAGIFYSNAAGSADSGNIKPRALIAQGKELERSYGEGDSLAKGIIIQKILPDQVVLARNGQLESLKLPRAASDPRQADDRVTAPASFRSDTTASRINPGTTIKAVNIAQQLRRKTQVNPDGLQDLAYANPYVQDGRFVGLQLKPGRDRRLLPQLGLRSGDVLTELNGVKLTDASQSITLFQELLNADQINAKVLRGGVEIPFTFLLTE